MTNYKAIFFDFDGVIAHTQPIMQQALWRFFRERQMAVAESEYDEDGWASKSLLQVCEILAQKHDIHLEVNELRSHIWQAQVELMHHGLESDPTLIPFLEYCKQSGIRIAIGSNSIRDRVEWVLKKMRIEEYFLKNPLLEGGTENGEQNKGDLFINKSSVTPEFIPPKAGAGQLLQEGAQYAIIGANDITHHKPDPEVWIKCAEILEVPIESCLVIEDGLPGLTGAKQCGARGIYYHRFSKPEKSCVEIAEKSVESYSELLEYLQ